MRHFIYNIIFYTLLHVESVKGNTNDCEMTMQKYDGKAFASVNQTYVAETKSLEKCLSAGEEKTCVFQCCLEKLCDAVVFDE